MGALSDSLILSLIVIVLIMVAPLAYAHTDLYQKGFTQGVIDGRNGVLDHTSHGKTTEEQLQYSSGYTKGWLKSCGERGLDTSADGPCELSIDAD